MAIVTPVMLKFMYNDEELTDLTNKTHKLFKQHMEETAVRNKEFRLPPKKDKRSLSFQYEHLNLLKPKFALSPEKRRPLSAPHPNSPYYREPANSDDGLNVDDFDYRYDIESDDDDQAKEKEVGKEFLRRSASAASPLRGGAGSSLRSLRGQSPDPKLSYSKQFYRESGRLVQSLDWGLDLALQGPGLSPSMVASQNAGGRGSLASPGPGASSLLNTNGRGPETSKLFIKKHRQRLEAQQDALYKQVFEEARRLQLRFTTLVKEANAFAQALGHVGTRYRIVERAAHEDAAWDRILRDYEGRGKGRGGGWSLLDGPRSPPASASADKNISIPAGTGKRIEKMLVEVTEEGRDVRYLGVSHFQSEHKRLQAAVNKQLAIKPITPVMDPDEEERKLQAAVLAAAENESHHNSHHSAGRGHGGQSAIDHLKTMSHGHSHSHSHSATNVDASEQSAKEKADRERALLLKSGLRPPRHEVEDKLRQILAMQTVKVITLQKQLAKIQQMGWNKDISLL